MKLKKILALMLAVTTLLVFASCTGNKPEESTGETTPAQTENESPVIDSELKVNVMVLNGTTGFGMAALMDQNASGNAALNYNFSVESAAPTILSALINGSVDIAALPTNAAATVFNKTEGKVKICAINTLGVLYVVENGENITDFASLKGKTVHVPGQGSNPEYVFNYLCAENGLVVGEDITVDYSYNEPADLRTAVAAGNVEIAVLPEPMVTIACSANKDLRVALDLTEEWNAVAPKDSLVQGCVVVRSEFAEAHPNEMAAFLDEYKASVQYAIDEPESAGGVIAEQGIFANAAVASKALPNCNVCFIAGEEMSAKLDPFFAVLFEANPASVGGKLPTSDIYYVAE
jgi:NitT/TauT family transport system substrate-binding protein